MLATGTIVKERYEVIGLLGQGGMSVVYRATDLKTGKPLVIKETVKKGENNQIMEKSLVEEGKLLMNLSNPHLPRTYDVIEEKKQIMIVMDYIEGQSLDKILAQCGPLSPEKVIEWGIQICDVFTYLHNQKSPIIYRDMKPANVILQPNGNIMMIDFGTARTWKMDDVRTSDTILFGTQGFAAPEQFGGQGQSDARTDIFCLGATLFNLVTNHSPYMKPFGITPLGNWNPALKDCMLDRIIQKCTETDPDKRYQTAEELKQVLQEAAKNNNQGKSGFLGRFAKPGQKKSGSDWQSPEMKVADGKSIEFHHSGSLKKEQAPEIQSKNYQKEVASPVVSKKEVNFRPLTPSDDVRRQMAFQEQRKAIQRAEDENRWKMATLIAMIIGIAMFLIGLILIISEAVSVGIIFFVLAIAALTSGVISAIRYTNLK